MMTRPSLLLLSTLLLAPPPSARPSARSSSSAFVVNAFAEWTKCWTDLEEGEIIMNQPVQRQPAFPESASAGAPAHATNNDDDDDGGGGGEAMVRLIAMDPNGREAKSIRIRTKDGPGNDDANYGDDPNEPAEEASPESKYEVVVPFAPGQTFHLKLQSAASPTTNKDDDANNSDTIPSSLPANTQYLAQTTGGARFLGRSAMCDDTRAVGRKRNDVIRIQLTGEEETVRLWAGYASEKAAVILTPELVFRLDPASERVVAAKPSSAPAPAPAPAPVPSAPTPPVAAQASPPDL